MLEQQASGTPEEWAPQDIFYSCPSTSAEAFFEAVSRQLATLQSNTRSISTGIELEQTLELASAVKASTNSSSVADALGACVAPIADQL